MTIKVLPEEIIKYWDIIRYAIEQSANNINSYIFVRNTLIALLSEDAQCWFTIDDVERKIKLVTITKITKEQDGTKKLWIEAIYGYIPTGEEDKLEGINKMIEFAKSQDCSSIVAYSPNSKAWSACEKAGLRFIGKVYYKEVS